MAQWGVNGGKNSALEQNERLMRKSSIIDVWHGPEYASGSHAI